MFDKSFVLFLLVVIIILLIAGKFATKTVMNAVRIGLFALGLFTLYRNWPLAKAIFDKIYSDILPFIWNKTMAFFDWVIDLAIKKSGEAITNFLK